MSVILQLLFLVLIYIVFFRRRESDDYSEAAFHRLVEKIRSTWDMDDLRILFYRAVERFPQDKETIVRHCHEQQRLLNALAMNEPWADQEVRNRIYTYLARCGSIQDVIRVQWHFAELLNRFPQFRDAFRNPKAPQQEESRSSKALFAMCQSIPEIKKRFRRLAFLNHPDRGGNAAAMREILRQYEEALESKKGT